MVAGLSAGAIAGLGGALIGGIGSIVGGGGGGSSGSPNAGASGSTTTTNVTQPWSVQQPYLQQGFGSAQDLFYGPKGLGSGTYQPAYYPGSTVSPFNTNENNGLNWELGQSSFNSPVLNQALASGNTIAGPGFTSSNPGNATYQELAGLNDPKSALGLIANGYSVSNNPSIDSLSKIASGTLQNGGNNILSAYSAGTQGNNPANAILNSTAQQGGIGNSALDQYASGQMLGSQNPAWQSLVSSVDASVLPGIESQFTQGNSMNNPAAAYAVSQGLGSALAPYAEQNYNTQTQNQINAANVLSGNALNAGSTLGSQYLTGTGQGIGAASNLASNILGGQSLQAQAANELGNQYNAGIANTLSGQSQLAQNLGQSAQGLSGNYNTAIGQQIQNELALPGLSSAATSNAGTAFNVGQAQQQQSQAQLNDLVNRYNYTQNLPLNLLNAYQSSISGNYGGTSSLTQPYFTNSTANILSGALGGLSLAKGVGNLFDGSSSSSGSGAGSSNLFNFAFNGTGLGAPATNPAGYMTFGGGSGNSGSAIDYTNGYYAG